MQTQPSFPYQRDTGSNGSDNNSNNTLTFAALNRNNLNNSNSNSPSPLIPNGRPAGGVQSKPGSIKSNGVNGGSTDNSKGSDGSKGSIISNGAMHDEYRPVRNSIL